MGIGGEDQHEVEICGVDQRTRGRRMDECLQILRGLATGEPVTFEDALIVPAPSPPIPLVAADRDPAKLQHAMNVWCGFGATREASRAALALGSENFYRIPFESFERYSPYGTPQDVAEFLAAYVEAGGTTFNLIPCTADGLSEEAAVGEVRRLLRTVD